MCDQYSQYVPSFRFTLPCKPSDSYFSDVSFQRRRNIIEEPSRCLYALVAFFLSNRLFNTKGAQLNVSSPILIASNTSIAKNTNTTTFLIHVHHFLSQVRLQQPCRQMGSTCHTELPHTCYLPCASCCYYGPLHFSNRSQHQRRVKRE